VKIFGYKLTLRKFKAQLPLTRETDEMPGIGMMDETT